MTVFNDFGEDLFARVNHEIKQLEFKKNPHIIHTYFEGVRVVDYKLSGIFDEALAFSPKNFFDIEQVLKRGARDFSKSC